MERGGGVSSSSSVTEEAIPDLTIELGCLSIESCFSSFDSMEASELGRFILSASKVKAAES
jgi:hypothetical protein